MELIDVPAAAGAEADVVEARPRRVVIPLARGLREALVAIDVVGLSYEEAAKALGVRQGTITSRLFRARERVARTMGVKSGDQRRSPHLPER